MIKKNIYTLSVFLAGCFLLMSHNTLAYYDLTSAPAVGYSIQGPVTQTVSYDDGYSYTGTRVAETLSYGYVSINHRVGMTSGWSSVEVNTPINFAYNPDPPFFTSNGGGFDTPYGQWKNSFDVPSKSEIVNYGAYTPTYFRGNVAYIYWTAIKPYVYMTSNNSSVVQCSGMNCRSVGPGVATVTAHVDGTQAHMWAVLYGGNWTFGMNFPGGVVFPSTYSYDTTWYNSGDEYNAGGYITEYSNSAAYMTPNSGIVYVPPTAMSWTISVSNPAACTGAIPAGFIMCAGDNVSLTTTLPWQNVAACTGARKCEYFMPQCTGAQPANTIICPNDNAGLTMDVAWASVGTAQAQCTNTRKCEYYTPTCTTAVPYSTPCPNDNIGLSVSVTNTVVAPNGCTEIKKCENTCNSGYVKSGNTCVPATCINGPIPQGATRCPGTETGLTADVIWEQVTQCNETEKCKYTLKAECGNEDRSITKPSSDLCKPFNTNDAVSYNDQGFWKWICTHEDARANPRIDDCESQSCLAQGSGLPLPFNLQSQVYFDADGKPNDASVSVNCKNADVCCTVKNKQMVKEVTVCQGDPQDGRIVVTPGVDDYPTECWYDDTKNRTNDPDEQLVKYSPNIKTMCTSRTCSNQGACQKTPKATDDPSDCSSSCSSDADCASGKMIETRP